MKEDYKVMNSIKTNGRIFQTQSFVKGINRIKVLP